MLRRVLLLGLVCGLFYTQAALIGAERAPVKKPYGIETRTPWNSSRIQGSPDPSPPYLTEVAFPGIRFDEPLNAAAEPDGKRLFVAQRDGKIFSFINSPASKQADLVLDVGRMTYGMTLHPQFKENGYLYVVSIIDPAQELPEGTLLTRYQVTSRNPPRAKKSSETILMKWPSGGHNGGCLRFGPDGYLYIATGDASGIADERQTGQDISDLVGAILRIDVDQQSKELPYRIPDDNPFVGTSGARGEIWAFGLRQAWKFSFDQKSKTLWAGEIGQDLWESIHIIKKGANYGWSIQEGRHPFRPERKQGPGPIETSIVEHPHSDFRSITGGYVYWGSRLPELQGAYLYADYDTGKIWMLRYDGTQVTENRELTDTNLRIVEFSQDDTGEVYFVDHIGGQLHQLVHNPKQGEKSDFPHKLSETGLFTSTTELTPTPGLIPYSVNSPLWSDDAIKERYLALPGDSQIGYNDVPYPQPAPGAPRGWKFPDGTVAVKTFSLEMEKGNPATARRLETRILHLQQTPGTDEVGDQVWRGYTYVWNEDQTDAELLDAAGKDVTFTIADSAAPGGKREQTWHFPSRAECTMCHTMPAKYVLGLDTLQLNRDHNYGGVVANQLATFAHLGLFKEPLPNAPDKLPRLPDYTDETADLNGRARAYLHSNCSHCHRKWGGGNASFQLLATLDLPETGTIGVRPNHGSFELREPSILTPGDPERSMIYYRMTLLGLGRMPHIASTVKDEAAIKLMGDWIRKLPEIDGKRAVDIGTEGIPTQ